MNVHEFELLSSKLRDYIISDWVFQLEDPDDASIPACERGRDRAAPRTTEVDESRRDARAAAAPPARAHARARAPSRRRAT